MLNKLLGNRARLNTQKSPALAFRALVSFSGYLRRASYLRVPLLTLILFASVVAKIIKLEFLSETWAA